MQIHIYRACFLIFLVILTQLIECKNYTKSKEVQMFFLLWHNMKQLNLEFLKKDWLVNTTEIIYLWFLATSILSKL